MGERLDFGVHLGKVKAMWTCPQELRRFVAFANLAGHPQAPLVAMCGRSRARQGRETSRFSAAIPVGDRGDSLAVDFFFFYPLLQRGGVGLGLGC